MASAAARGSRLICPVRSLIAMADDITVTVQSLIRSCAGPAPQARPEPAASSLRWRAPRRAATCRDRESIAIAIPHRPHEIGGTLRLGRHRCRQRLKQRGIDRLARLGDGDEPRDRLAPTSDVDRIARFASRPEAVQAIQIARSEGTSLTARKHGAREPFRRRSMILQQTSCHSRTGPRPWIGCGSRCPAMAFNGIFSHRHTG